MASIAQDHNKKHIQQCLVLSKKNWKAKAHTHTLIYIYTFSPTCSMFSLIFQFENEKEPNFKSIQKL